MKRELVDLLCCPDCKRDLTLVDDAPRTFAGGPARDIETGALLCRECDTSFPIVRGIPRFVGSDKYVGSFSYEWNRWNRVQLDVANGRSESEETFAGKTGFTPADLKGKLVLDVGCGAGRFLDVASRWGATAIGIDLSFAVEASQKNLGDRANVSVIQADVFRLPFRDGTFDAIFSIGVLHHSNDTREAFLQLPPLLTRGGELAVWLYYYPDQVYCAASDFWRAVLRPLPSSVIYAWSWLLVTLFSWLWTRPIMSRRPFEHLRRVLPVNTHPDRHWRILDTFDWYSPRYQDKACSPARVLGWCREGGIRDVQILDFLTSIRGRRDPDGELPLVRWSVPDLRTKRVLVFGAGAAGRNIVQLLRKMAPGSVIGIADNDPSKEGALIEDRTVKPFAHIPRDSYDVVVIASLPGRVEISRQLEAAGFVAERDFVAADRVEQWFNLVSDKTLLAA